jgi:hypothetical protein
MKRPSTVNREHAVDADSDTAKSVTGVVHRYKPSPRECALLLMHLWRKKEEELDKRIVRLCVTDLSLKKLWLRSQITNELLHEVNEWLSEAGAVIFFARTIYGIVKIDVVEGWARTTYKRLSVQLDEVAEGRFDFDRLDHLLSVPADTDEEEA